MVSKAKQIAEKLYTPYKPTVFEWGVTARLPEAYKKFWKEWKETTPEPVHYVAEKETWRRTIHGEMKRIENVPIPGLIPPKLNQVITGGEMVVLGFKKKTKYSCRNPHYWTPIARNSVIYSEVLDKYIKVLITYRAIDLIMQHNGFDNYVLKTKACDLQTVVTLNLKRRILLALRDRNLPYSDEKNKEIYDKYKEFLLPPEEIEWYGLTLSEACNKLLAMEEAEFYSEKTPLKHVYRNALIATLKEEHRKKESG